MIRQFVRFSCIALAVASAPLLLPASAQEAEEESYEPFDPSAPPLVFTAPKTIGVDFINPRTMSAERATIEPWLLVPAYGLEIYIFDVGQANSMLIVGPGPERKTLLVDLGKANDQGMTGRFSSMHVGQRIVDITGKEYVDYFLLSHFHRDHFGTGQSGVTDLIGHSGFKVGTMIDTGRLGTNYVKRSQEALDYMAFQQTWIDEGKVGQRINPVFGTSQIDLGKGVKVAIQAFAGRVYRGDKGVHAKFTAKHPAWYAANPPSENDLSIALKITVGSFEFWSGGDLSGAAGDGTSEISGSYKSYTNVEYPLTKRWLSEGSEHDVEVYRANHHGSQYSSTPQLLEALDPEIILYSARGGHEHPSSDTVDRAGETALQMTTSFDPKVWDEAELADKSVKVTGEIRLFVAPGGKSYSVNGKAYQSFTDVQEKAGDDE